MESKMVKVKVRLKNIELQESTNLCIYLKKSRSYLVVDGFNRVHKNVKRDLLKSQIKGLKLYLKSNTSFTTICLPFGIYIAIKKMCSLLACSLNYLVNYCLMYELRLIKINKKVRDSLLVKNEKFDSLVKKRYSVFMLIYGYQKRLRRNK